MDVFQSRRTFLGSLSGSGSHLWLVLTDPDDVGHVIAVMAVSSKSHTDKTLSLVVGDHPWIRRETNIDYGAARSFPVAKLLAANERGQLTLEADMSPDLLERVQQGLLASSRTIHAVKDEFRARMNLAVTPTPPTPPNGPPSVAPSRRP